MEKLHSKLLYIAANLLNNKGIKNSYLEAEILLSFSLEIKRESLPLLSIDKAAYKTIKYFFSLLERRLSGEPVSYLTERKDFFSLSFYVNHNVLIPRPETEAIVEYVLENKELLSAYYLDLCTGSGCIINTLGKANKSWGLVGGDIESNTLKIASKNMKLCGNSRVSFFMSNLFNAIPKVKYKLITCNPPYIKELDVLHVNKDIRYYEPLISLRAGEDGLFFYRKLADKLKLFLIKSGLCIVEIGIGQKEELLSIFRQKDLFLKEVLRDLAGIERVLIFGLRR